MSRNDDRPFRNVGYLRNPRTGRISVPGGGRRVHPTGTAFRGGRQVGETPYRYCVQCGTANDTRSTEWSNDGEGIERDFDAAGNPVLDENGNSIATITSGCSVCGSLFWQYTRPKKIKDRSILPSREARLRQKRW